MKIISIILARGGSKGIPKKNIIDVNGYPLISYTINASKESNIKETWVCTEDEEIANISKLFGANVLSRPYNLSTDNSKSEESLLYFANQIDFDILVFIQPTSPLLTSQYINQGINLILSNNYDSVFSAFKEHWVPRWNLDFTPDNWWLDNRPMRQDIEEKFVENGAFYITKKHSLLSSQLRYSGNIGIVEMPFSKSFQIDTQDDLELIKKLI